MFNCTLLLGNHVTEIVCQVKLCVDIFHKDASSCSEAGNENLLAQKSEINFILKTSILPQYCCGWDLNVMMK